MKKFVLFFAAAAFLASCATYNVSAILPDKSVNMAQYKTYSYMDIDQSKLPQSVSIAHVALIKSALDKQMAARGYKLTTTGTSDLLINLGIFLKYDKEADATTTFNMPGGWYGPYGYWGPMNYGWGSANTHVDINTYTTGTLLVDMVDPRKNELVWHGSVSHVLEQATNQAKAEENLDKAMVALFKDYPVAAPAK